MIPEIFVEQWRGNTNWQTLGMIEQDMVISRALISIYNNQAVKDSLLFRGGTALNKIYIQPASRYSEDIDFVQKRAEPIGKTLDQIKSSLIDWLGEPKRVITERSAKLVYKYQSIEGTTARLKIEINTTEHIQALPIAEIPFSMESEWHSGKCDISSYTIEELMATKLRALYQRRKGRDLYDLWLVFSSKRANIDIVLPIFHQYCQHEGINMSKSLFQKNLNLKRLNPDFRVDMNTLLPSNSNWDFEKAFDFVHEEIISKI